MSHNQEVGRWGEDLAVQILQSQGFELLERNWRPQSQNSQEETLRGEIDAVMTDPSGELVFVEVKTRSGKGYGHPLQAIDRTKSQKLRHLAHAWCQENRQRGFRAIRIDAVAVTGTQRDFCFEHLRAVV